MHSLADRLRQANALLAPYAVPHGGSLGRIHPEESDATRFPFQRDRDRIIHTQAFRRLKHKTQVFVAGLPTVARGAEVGHSDHFRTRITHTLEVAQISKDIARALSLNEDLAEAIALAHDLGHTPFGHAGEEAMAACMVPFQKTFEHNLQSYRIVTLLEDRSTNYRGLNLSQEILAGLLKHETSHDQPGQRSAGSDQRAASLEAQIVNCADEIAYTAHDTDDGLRAKQFSMADVRGTQLGAQAWEQSKDRGTELRGAIVDLLVTDLLRETDERIRRGKIRSLADVYGAQGPLAGFSSAMEDALAGLRDFLWHRLYLSPAVQRQARRGKRIVTALFERYLKHPPAKVKALKEKTDSALEDAVKDYIAGMTDGYAMEEHKRMKEE